MSEVWGCFMGSAVLFLVSSRTPKKKHTHNIQRVLAGTPPPESLEDFVYMFLALLLMSFSLL